MTRASSKAETTRLSAPSPSLPGPPHRVLLWGTAAGIDRLLDLFDRHPRRGWRAAAAACVDGSLDLPSDVHRLSGPPEEAGLEATGVDAVVLAQPAGRPRPAFPSGVPVYEGLELVERWDRQIPLALRDPGKPPDLRQPSRTFRVGKRTLDLALSLPIGVLTLPLVGLLALLVRLESPGPALFTQWRVGRAGKPFRIWKLRTMVEGADRQGATTTHPGDERITRMGRFLRRWRLDELPQLWNVLLGEMSLVGPRPEQPEILEELMRDLPFLELRLAATPGLTGWAQVRYGYVSTPSEMREKFGYDLWYLRHRSLRLDLEILLRTLGVVLSGRGVR